MVERTIRFASLRAPDAQDLEGVKTWIREQQPLTREGRDHLLKGTDFLALVEKQEEGWLDKIVEQALWKCFPKDVPFILPSCQVQPTKCGRASSPRRNNVISVETQIFAYAASTALIY